MPETDHILIVVSEWLVKAEDDLRNAVHTLEMGETCPTDTVCFHAQQCAEKYLKAFLVWKGIDFPRTHDIGTLVALLPGGIDLKLTAVEQRNLTNYATITRYPGDYEPTTLDEARQAVKSARRVRREIRRSLPKERLRYRRK